MLIKLLVVITCVVALSGCAKNKDLTSAANRSDEAAPVEGVEKVKPAPGTGNVQGKVLYNNAPVENIEVKLCETFSRFLSGCGGKTYTAKTDKDGDFVIPNVEPKEYEALTVRVFDTDSYVFATAGIGISAAKYNVTADKTLFVAPTHLFKGDLKTVNPKDASYYKFSLSPDNHMVTAPYTNEKVEGTSFKVAKPLEKGGYRLKVEAYNSKDKKLSETNEETKFTVN
jgi:hypothetical protein